MLLRHPVLLRQAPLSAAVAPPARGRVLDVAAPTEAAPGPATPSQHDAPKPGFKRWRGFFDPRAALAEYRGETQTRPQSRGERLIKLAEEAWGHHNARMARDWMVHEGSAANVAHKPHVLPHLPEIALVSRKDVGKESLLTRLFTPFGKSLMHAAQLPGNESVINYYRIGNMFRIVDTPGFGFTSETPKVQHAWQNAVRAMCAVRPTLKHVYLLTEVKPNGFTERDAMMMEFLAMHRIEFTQIITRADGIVTHPMSPMLKEMSEEEREIRMLQQIQELKKDTGCEAVQTIVTGHKGDRGLGACLYDIVARVMRDVPDESLSMHELSLSPASCPDTLAYRMRFPKTVDDSPVTNPTVGPDDDTSFMLTDTEFLPPAALPHGFFYNKSVALKHRPPRERVSLKMKTEAQEADEDGGHHPLIGTPELANYFPTLAEDYLHRNNADLNPTVKPKAEQYFGMSLPVDLRMKYATPDEKEEWRKLLNKPH